MQQRLKLHTVYQATIMPEHTEAFVHSWLLKLEEVSNTVDEKAKALLKVRCEIEELEHTLESDLRCQVRCAAGKKQRFPATKLFFESKLRSFVGDQMQQSTQDVHQTRSGSCPHKIS